MNLLSILFLLLGLGFLVYHYIAYMKVRATHPDSVKGKVVRYLFLAYMALVALPALLADVLLEQFGIQKPPYFDAMAFGGFCVLAVVIVFIFKNGKNMKEESKNKSESNKTPEKPPTTQIIQNHSGSGDNVAGDKIGRQINMGGNSTYIENQTNTSTTPNPNLSPIKTQVQNMVANGNLGKALDYLKNNLPDQQNDIVQLQSRLNKLNRASRLGTISAADENLERNRITAAILNII